MQRIEPQRIVALLVLGLLVSSFGTAGAQETRTRQRTGIMPAVSPAQFVDRGVQSVDRWAEATASLTGNRKDMYGAIGTLLSEIETFENEVEKIYPREQLEWLLITDEVSDTVAVRLAAILEEYQEKHPDEVLTEGRQVVELALMQILGPPIRMLGFHVVMLSKFVHTQADTLLTSPQAQKDPEGVYDGVLRNIRDWCGLYEQAHFSQRSIYESRINQEDWIISRLKDNCGQSKWKITNQYMAMVGVDSTKTPPQDMFAHEFHLESTVCEGDTRVIHVNLPNFQAMQLELLDEARQKEAR